MVAAVYYTRAPGGSGAVETIYLASTLMPSASCVLLPAGTRSVPIDLSAGRCRRMGDVYPPTPGWVAPSPSSCTRTWHATPTAACASRVKHAPRPRWPSQHLHGVRRRSDHHRYGRAGLVSRAGVSQGETLAARLAGGPLAFADAVQHGLADSRRWRRSIGVAGASRKPSPDPPRGQAPGFRYCPTKPGGGRDCRRAHPRSSAVRRGPVGEAVDARADLFALGAVLFDAHRHAGAVVSRWRRSSMRWHEEPPVLVGSGAITAFDRHPPRARKACRRSLRDGVGDGAGSGQVPRLPHDDAVPRARR